MSSIPRRFELTDDLVAASRALDAPLDPVASASALERLKTAILAETRPSPALPPGLVGSISDDPLAETETR